MGNTPSDISEEKSIFRHLDDDVLQLVCEDLHDLVLHNKTLPMYGRPEVSMIPLSLTCKRFRTLCLPYIFQTFSLECYAKNPWWEASNKVKSWNPDLSPHIREISIDMCIRYKYEDSWLAIWFVSSLPDALAHALHHLSTTSPHLDKLSMKISDDKYPVFQAAFDKIGLAFPTVSRLAIMNCPTHDSVMQLCPNVRFLSIVGIRYVHTDEWVARVCERASRLTKLEGLLVDVWYSLELLGAMAKALPKIKTLVVRSQNRHRSFEELVIHLARFQAVEVLVVPSVATLDIGFDPPGCGNAYFGPGGEEYRQQVEREGREAERRVAKDIFDRCPQVKELWFDMYSRATRESGLDGRERGESKMEYYRKWQCTWAKNF